MIRAGGCQCGAVRFTLALERVTAYACHCRECQKQSASAFALSIPAPRSALALEGETASWTRKADSGAETTCHFCPRCGSRLFHRSSAAPDAVTIKAGALDDTSDVRPLAHFWVSRKQPWVRLDPDVAAFETQPDDLAAWRAARPR